MTKTTQKATRLFFKCQPCDEIEDRDRTYTRSYDLVAHLVNTHKLYPVSIKHNATYLPLKSDLRAATVEEILKYKDANKHGRKRAAESTSTGQVSASGTATEPEGLAGTSGEREVRREKSDAKPAGEKGGKRDSERAIKVREPKELREDAGREAARIAKETADEKDAAEDEADHQEYLVLQNKMEARRLAREIKVAHDTLASLRAEQKGTSAKSGDAAEASDEGEKTKGGIASTSAGGNKKPRASRPPWRASVGDPGTTTANEATTKAQGGKQPDKAAVLKKAADKPVAKRPKSTIEAPRKATTTVRSSDEDSRTEALGPALVAGALGRKLGDVRTAMMLKGITECRVELLTTRQKAKLPLPAVPHNSAESNSVADGSYVDDARLSLSATDLHVQVELPGDARETVAEIVSPRMGDEENRGGQTNVEPRRVSLVTVAIPVCGRPTRETDPTNEGIQSARAVETKSCDDGVPTVPGENLTRVLEPTATTNKTAESGDKGAESAGIEANEKRRALRDVEVALAMREHLAVTDPGLVMASSLLSAVRGQPRAPETKTGGKIVATSASRPSRAETSPSTGRYRGGGDVESDSEPETTDVVVVDDTEKSEGEMSGDESSSESSSGGSSSDSGRSRVSRKRAADGSPEREYIERGRQPFPGATSRSTGGCRVHLPTPEAAECATTEALSANRETTTVVHDVPCVMINTAVRVPAQLLAPPQPTAAANEIGRGIVLGTAMEAVDTRAVNNRATSTAMNPTNEWGRHGFVVAEIYKVMATMEPPWGSLCVYEAVARRFPEVDPTALQMTVLAVLMTQRQCVRDLTLAGARRGPRRDENGEVFIELDLVYANRYSDSY